MNKLKEVYEKFRHLDRLLSDKELENSEDKIHSCCYELWKAIQETIQKE